MLRHKFKIYEEHNFLKFIHITLFPIYRLSYSLYYHINLNDRDLINNKFNIIN